MIKSRITASIASKLVTLEVMLICVMFVWYAYRFYSTQTEMVEDQLKASSASVDKALNDAFASAEAVMRYIGHLCIQKEEDPDEIYKLFLAFDPAGNMRDLLTWSSLSWSDDKLSLRVDSAKGVLEPPYKQLSKRYYIYISKQQPWELQVGKITYGIVSKEKILPIAMGISSAQGRYLGSIFSGFRVDKFKQKLDQALSQIDKFSFAVFDGDGEVIIETEDKYISQHQGNVISSYLRELNNDKRLSLISYKHKKIIMQPLGHSNLYFALALHNTSELLPLKYIIKKTFFDLSLVIGVCLILTLYIRKFIVNPIVGLTEAAKNIEQSNSAFSEIKTYNEYELEVLADSLRELTEHKLELKDIKQKLEFLRSQIDSTNKVKAEFIKHMQHEIRTPLSHIMGGAELLKKLYDEQEEKGNTQESRQAKLEYCNVIYQSATDLLDMLNNVISAADMESGNLKLNEEECSINDMISELMEDLNSNVVQKNINVELSIEDDLPNILVDKKKFKVVLMNILHNSIKFNGIGGNIYIEVIKAKSGIIFSIKDTGEGIPKADLDRITEMFEYSGELMKKMHKGIGLGLTIAKNFLELHDARLEIQSEQGKGTTIIITVPNIRISQEN